MARSTMMWVMTMVVMTSFIMINEAVDGSTSEEYKKTDANLLSQKLEAQGFRNCPPPYTNILGECFYIHKYIPVLKWEDARSFCKQAGGILAEPKYFGAVIAHLYNTGMANKIYRDIFNNVWVGGHRVGNSTTFKWSSGRPIEDPVAIEADPYFSDRSGDCIIMRMHKNAPVHLRPISCDTETHYACQLL